MQQQKFLPSGDSALTVEFGDTIDQEISNHVLALAAALETCGLPVTAVVPTYRSLLIEYDAIAIDYDEMCAALMPLCAELPDSAASGRHWEVPVVYGGTFGIDLTSLAARHAMTEEELIARHSSVAYRVYMIGFVPGFTYLGGLDRRLETPRLPNPRLKVPPGSIAIGGAQTAVASIEAPSGWHQIGRTPVRAFMPSRDPVCLFAPGDTVTFRPIANAQWEALSLAAYIGEPVARLLA